MLVNKNVMIVYCSLSIMKDTARLLLKAIFRIYNQVYLTPNIYIN